MTERTKTEPSMIRRGLMLVLSSPSGAGKSTIARHLLDSEPNLALSVSATTRARRGSEIDGVHYHFLSERQFHAMRDRGIFWNGRKCIPTSMARHGTLWRKPCLRGGTSCLTSTGRVRCS